MSDFSEETNGKTRIPTGSFEIFPRFAFGDTSQIPSEQRVLALKSAEIFDCEASGKPGREL